MSLIMPSVIINTMKNFYLAYEIYSAFANSTIYSKIDAK